LKLNGLDLPTRCREVKPWRDRGRRGGTTVKPLSVGIFAIASFPWLVNQELKQQGRYVPQALAFKRKVANEESVYIDPLGIRCMS
jgi:hypothetical protein